MVLALQVVTVFLVGVTMRTALVHALEFPGKLRLDEHNGYGGAGQLLSGLNE